MRAERPPRFLTPYDRFVRWNRARRLRRLRELADDGALEPLAALGARHVRRGIIILGGFEVAALVMAAAAALDGDGVTLGSVLVAALCCAGYAVALWRGAPAARLVALVGLVLSAGLAGAAALVALVAPPMLLIAALLALLAAGFGYSWVTAPAQAWHRVRERARARGKARSLVEWRMGGTGGASD